MANLAKEPIAPDQPKYDYTRVIEIYDKILTDYPNSDFADDALYTKAYLLQQMDQGVESRKIYQEVIDRYPDRHFAADSYMRLAEYYFDPREDKDTSKLLSNFTGQSDFIKKYCFTVIQNGMMRHCINWAGVIIGSPLQDPAYYSDAIIYFIAVVDDIVSAEELDPKNLVSNPNVKERLSNISALVFPMMNPMPMLA